MGKGLPHTKIINAITKVIGEAGTVGKNLAGDLVGEGIQIALCLLGQKHLAGHAVRTFFLFRLTL